MCEDVCEDVHSTALICVATIAVGRSCKRLATSPGEVYIYYEVHYVHVSMWVSIIIIVVLCHRHSLLHQ